MARWRGKKRQQRILTMGAFGAIAFLLLAWFATKISWDSVSFVVLIIILFGFAAYAFSQLLHVIQFHIEKSEKIERASRIKSTTQMGFLSPTDFEHYVGMLYESLGHSVTVTKQSGDSGIDLILKNKEGVTAVQVKRYGNTSVGRPEIQKLVGASIRDYDKMIFVTTSDFTIEAREYAAQHGVLLVNGAALTAMAKKVFGENHEQKTFSFRFQRKMEERV